MTDEYLFKLYDECITEEKGYRESGCKHDNVVEGVCENCGELLYQPSVNEEDFLSRTYRRGDNKQNKINHFYNFLQNLEWPKGEDSATAYDDFKWFLKTYNGLEKKRKNHLLNKWVLWQLLEMRGVECQEYHIKSKSSNAEHRELGQRCFDILKWGKLK